MNTVKTFKSLYFYVKIDMLCKILSNLIEKRKKGGLDWLYILQKKLQKLL